MDTKLKPNHQTLDELIAECQAMTVEKLRSQREPPPMQSFVSGPPKWAFWIFAVPAVVLVLAGICVLGYAILRPLF